MRAYLVKADVPAGDATSAFRRYAGSQSEAADIKRDLFEKHKANGLKRNTIVVDTVDIPTNKADLIPWLNKNAVA